MRDREVDQFWSDQRQQLVELISAYCGDADVAEDIVQDALLRGAENWTDLREMDAPGGWLYRVAVNLTNSCYRRRDVGRRVLDRLDAGEQWVVDPDPAVRVALLRALETLPQRQRAAVTLRYLLDWSAADVADVMGTNENTVRSLAHRGLARLRLYFDEQSTSSTIRTGRAGVIGLVALVAVAAAALALALRTETPGGVFIDLPPDESPLDSIDDLGAQHWTTVAEGSLDQTRSWTIDVAEVAGEVCVRVSVASQPLDFLTDWAISCRPPLGASTARTLAVDVGFSELIVGRLSDDIAEVRARSADGEARLAEVVGAPEQQLRLLVLDSPIGETLQGRSAADPPRSLVFFHASKTPTLVTDGSDATSQDPGSSLR